MESQKTRFQNKDNTISLRFDGIHRVGGNPLSSKGWAGPH